LEPDPQHPEREHNEERKPDVIENALLGLSSIPSYQFIRDDIRRILARNLLVDRVQRVLDGIERDYELNDHKFISGAKFRAADV